MKRGDKLFLAYPDEVVACTFVEDGDDGRNFKRKPKDPIVVHCPNEGGNLVVERASVHHDALAAAIASAELLRKIDETP